MVRPTPRIRTDNLNPHSALPALVTTADFPHLRMSNQRLGRLADTPSNLVREMCALQGQDYSGVLWSIGMRSEGATDASVESAFDDRRIVRTWAMRGTLHVVAAEDVRWILALLSPKIVRSAASRHRQLELDEPTFTRSFNVMERSLRDGAALTRDEMRTALEEEGISTAGQRLSHILQRAALEQFVCFGSRRGKQHTFVMLDEWIHRSTTHDRHDALRDLALRYFSTRGPANLQDFRWWSGLAARDARDAVEAATPELTCEIVDEDSYWMPKSPIDGAGPSTHVLPMFDEYILAYKDRDAVIPKQRMQEITGLNGMFRWTIVRDGRIIGTWNRWLRKDAVAIEFDFFQPATEGTTDDVVEAARRYATFLGLSADLESAFGGASQLS